MILSCSNSSDSLSIRQQSFHTLFLALELTERGFFEIISDRYLPKHKFERFLYLRYETKPLVLLHLVISQAYFNNVFIANKT